MLRVLRIRDFRLITAGQLLSDLGDWLLLVAAPFHALHLTGSTLATGLAMAAESIPALLIGPIAGVFADRWDHRRTMLTVDTARAAVIASMLLIHRPGQLWILYAALVSEATLGRFFAPSMRTLIPTVVGRGPNLPAAKSIAAFTSGVVRLIGGPAGGALYALAGFPAVVIVDAASYLVSAATIAAIRHRTDTAVSGELTTERSPMRVGAFRRELRAGATHIRTTPRLLPLLLTGGAFFWGNAMLTALLVPYVGDVLHGTSSTMGLLFSALGVGYLLGAPLSRIVSTRFDDRTVVIVSLLTLAGVFAAAFNVRVLAWDVAFFTLIGLPAVCFLVTTDTVMTQDTPDRLLGRTSAVYGTVQAGATLAGTLTGAALGQTVGVSGALNVGVTVVAFAAAGAFLMPARGRRVRVPDEGGARRDAVAGTAVAGNQDPAAPSGPTSSSGLWLPRDPRHRLLVVTYFIEVGVSCP